jgi:hypothetical protein
MFEDSEYMHYSDRYPVTVHLGQCIRSQCVAKLLHILIYVTHCDEAAQGLISGGCNFLSVLHECVSTVYLESSKGCDIGL